MSRKLKHYYLITGTSGIGKTTLIKDLIKNFEDNSYCGYYKEEIKIGSLRRGYKLVTFDGIEHIVSHINLESGIKVGKFTVDIDVLNNLINTLREQIKDTKINTILIDEIGKIEVSSQEFLKFIDDIFELRKNVFVTTAKKYLSTFNSLTDRNDVNLIELNKSNRNNIIEKILRTLTE